MDVQALYGNPKNLVENPQQWGSLLRDFGDRVSKEAQPNERLNILTELRDKLNETLAETARRASSTLNENAPISRLPPETFIHICKLACPPTTHRSVLEIILLTHVCRTWRDALISYPIIWSHIFMWRASPEPLVTTMLQRSRGLPLTVSVQYYSGNPVPPWGCGCSHHVTWEDGDLCHNNAPTIPSLDLLEPFRVKIHTLNVRYLQAGNYDAEMGDILETPFFLKAFPNLESLRWSCRHIDDAITPFSLPRELFGPSLPRLQKLSMVNCYGPLSTDTPVLKVMSVECVAVNYHIEIFAAHLVHSLNRQQSLISLSLANCYIIPEAEPFSYPVSMKDLKEITLRHTDSAAVFRLIQCPSIGTFTTLRITPATQGIWIDDVSVNLTATDSFGRSVSTLVYMTNDSLRTAWEKLASTFQHAVTTLEMEDPHAIAYGCTAIPNLIGALPDLHTAKVRLPLVMQGFEVLHNILSCERGIARVERLVVEEEDPDEAKRNDEMWEAFCTEYGVREFLT